MPRSVSARPVVLLAATAAAVALVVPAAAASAPAAAPAATQPFAAPSGASAAHIVRTLPLPGARSIRIDSSGRANEVDAHGRVLATRQLPKGARTELGTSNVPDDLVRSLFATSLRPSAVALTLAGTAKTATVDQALTRAGATTHDAIATGSVHTVVAHVGTAKVTDALRTLRSTPGVVSAEPIEPVASDATGSVVLPKSHGADGGTPQSLDTPDGAGALPDNYAITHSLSAYLNGNGVDALGAYSTLEGQYHQLPGTGEIITNVSVGDLTDVSMTRTDPYVKYYGPTTVVRGNQRYLDMPSMPLIPTYVSDENGVLDPTGSTEGVDPTLDEVLLDFGVMAPLPHNLQRGTALGSGATDLLGIAPGAKYRLVVPQQPTTDQIAVAMLAAARQTPRPNVITASLGVGTDQIGFPGRYLEDDPLLESVIATIVHQYGIVVTISSNDGTRLYTPTAVNPDGGSTPTDVVTKPDQTTQVGDDAYSTTPSKVLDSGAIAVGATTLDDVLTQPGEPTGDQVRTGTFATTRINGSTAYSSGFGSRVDVSAPGDGIDVFEHTVGGKAQDVTPVLNGGTSASAPETAAAAAVVLQASRLAGHSLTPLQVRSLLERTGRTVAQPKQSDRPTTVGPQVDLTAAVDSLLPHTPAAGIVRISVAHHVDLGNLEGQYSEDTDPGRLDLTDEAVKGPVTFGIDTTGISGSGLTYELHVGDTVFSSAVPAIRVTPTELLRAAGYPLVGTSDRHIDYRVVVRRGSRTLASQSAEVTAGPTDGSYTVVRAPVVAPRMRLGSSLTVHYDLRGAHTVDDPMLVVSTVGHWSPTAGLFYPGYSVPLTDSYGTVTLPASAFTGGGGLYGVGIAQQGNDIATYNLYADFASVLVLGPHDAARPDAPQLYAAGDRGTLPSTGHTAEVGIDQPDYTLRYDVSSVPGATGAMYEISASGPTVFGAYNTITNAFGTHSDIDTVSTPPTRVVHLAATSGTIALSAASLPTNAVFYNIRVFATDASGTPVSEASPTSGLFDDGGLAPGGQVRSFDAVSGSDSVASVTNDGGGQTLYRFDPSTGRFGRGLFYDEHAGNGFQVVGVDPSLHTVALLHFSTQAQAIRVEVRSTVNGRLAGRPTTYAKSSYAVLGGRVDTTRHRALLLARRASDNADFVLPVDLATGAIGARIAADTGSTQPGSFNDLAIDPRNGDALLAQVTNGGFCGLFGTKPLAVVSPDDGTVTQEGIGGCTVTLQTSPGSDKLWTLGYRSFSLNFAGETTVNSIPLDDLSAEPTTGNVRLEPPSLLSVDGTNDVVMAGFALPLSPPRFGSAFGYPVDSNATGQLAVLDPATGATTHLITGLEFGGAVSQGAYNGTTERRVQLDPTTRTGWTFSADGTQLQSFTY